MPHPRARILVVAALVLAAACAPGPSLDGTAATPASSTTLAPPNTTPSPAPPAPPGGPFEEETPQIAPLDLFPVAPADLPPLDPLNGRIALHGADARIRSGGASIDLDTGTLPGQPTWSRDGSRLAVVSLDGRQPIIDIFEGRTGAVIAAVPTERSYFFLSWSHDGTRLAGLGPGVDENGDGRTVLDILDADGRLLHGDVAQAESLFIAWEPDGLRIAAHADDRLLRVDADGSTTDLGAVGTDFFAPKWIPFTNEILLVTDVEGSSIIARRSIDGADSLRSLGPTPGPRLGIAVSPDGAVAAISHNFDSENDPTAERIDLPVLPQTARIRSGSVEILDLETGELVEVFTGFTLWVEWNPQGTHLLIYEANVAAGTGTWWVHEYMPDTEPGPALEIVAFTPTPTFQSSYLAFADQFIESPRLWSPDGTQFVYAELADVGSLVRTADADAFATPGIVGAGEVGFWSPSPPAR
jgi:TolB protein